MYTYNINIIRKHNIRKRPQSHQHTNVRRTLKAPLRGEAEPRARYAFRGIIKQWKATRDAEEEERSEPSRVRLSVRSEAQLFGGHKDATPAYLEANVYPAMLLLQPLQTVILKICVPGRRPSAESKETRDTFVGAGECPLLRSRAPVGPSCFRQLSRSRESVSPSLGFGKTALLLVVASAEWSSKLYRRNDSHDAL